MADVPASPRRPISAISIISYDSDHSEPAKKKIKIADDDRKTDRKPALSALPGTYRLPAANLPAPMPAAFAQPVSANGYALPAPNQTGLGNFGAANGQRLAPQDDSLDAVISYGLKFLDDLRRNTHLRIDVNLRKLLQDPLSKEAKPLKVCDPHNIPPRLYEYFHLLTFHTNKILGVLPIWLDLCEFAIFHSLAAANLW